jgi:glycosyltransferase involved in cell wall biosynthesis
MADGLIVYSDIVKTGFTQRWIAESKVFICANHQEERHFSMKLKKAQSILSETINKFKLDGRKVILFVGRLTEVKNLDFLINSFSLARQPEPRALLVLVGDGDKRDVLQLLTNELNLDQQILFLGHQEAEELYVWYLLAGLFVLPSLSEPYGAVVNEALLAGLKVMCSSNAGANVLIKGGVNGLIFDPKDSHDFKVKFQDFIAKIQPITNDAAYLYKENLMPVKFERDVNGFLAAVLSGGA